MPQKLWALTLIFSLGTWGQALLAAENLTVPTRKCACRADVQDEFEEPIQFGFGPYKGECVNSCRFRRAIFIDKETARRFGGDNDHLVIANFLHQGQYWIARVPVNSTTSVNIGFEKFLSNIAHVLIRFRFPKSDPVVLFRQDGNWRRHARTRVHQLQDLVVSAEGVPPKDRNYDFLESSLGRYLFDYRVLSIEEEEHWMIDLKNHSVKQFALKTDLTTNAGLLRSALNESTNKSFKSAYQLFTNNCATAVMDVIDAEIKYKPSVLDSLGLVKVQRALPMDSYFGTIYALGAMHLVDRELPLENLEDEYQRTKSKL